MTGEQNKGSEEIVKIRGHHLDFLNNLIELIDAKILDESTKNEYIVRTMRAGYGEKYALKRLELANMLRDGDSDTKVKIITDLDDMCLADCQIKEEKGCVGDMQLINLDNNVILHYNLEPQKVYNSREILKILRNKETYRKKVHSLHLNPYKCKIR